MEILRPGYNLVEKNKIGYKCEDINKIISITEFLRMLNHNYSIPRRIKVVGFEQFLAVGDKDLQRYIRNLLSRNALMFMQKLPVILFSVDRITMDTEPYLGKTGEKQIRLIPIFGNRLEQIDVGFFYAPFNI